MKGSGFGLVWLYVLYWSVFTGHGRLVPRGLVWLYRIHTAEVNKLLCLDQRCPVPTGTARMGMPYFMPMDGRRTLDALGASLLTRSTRESSRSTDVTNPAAGCSQSESHWQYLPGRWGTRLSGPCSLGCSGPRASWGRLRGYL